MSAETKFLGVALLIFSILVVRRVTPLGAFLMIVGLLALAYYVCRNRYRR